MRGPLYSHRAEPSEPSVPGGNPMLKLMESSEPLSHPGRPGPAVLDGSSSPAGPVLGGHG